MRLNKILLILLVLTGCATNNTLPTTIVQKVDVPVAMPCAQTVPVTPTYCFPTLTTQIDIFDKVKCLLSDRKLDLAYQTELLAKLNACR